MVHFKDESASLYSLRIVSVLYIFSALATNNHTPSPVLQTINVAKRKGIHSTHHSTVCSATGSFIPTRIVLLGILCCILTTVITSCVAAVMHSKDRKGASDRSWKEQRSAGGASFLNIATLWALHFSVTFISSQVTHWEDFREIKLEAGKFKFASSLDGMWS